MNLPANQHQMARTAEMEVRFGLLTIPRPKYISKWVKECGIEEITMWVVETRNPSAAGDEGGPLGVVVFGRSAKL